jgi:uncharacterized protein YbaR (Trm112 family)
MSSEVMTMIECPCCHGEKWLWVHDEMFPDEPAKRFLCCHCDGKGTVSLLPLERS